MTIARRARLALLAATAAVLAACSSIAPDKPTHGLLYDFGPGAPVNGTSGASQPPLVLADIEAPSGLDSSALLYRLAYADANQLRPYAQSRWSAPPQRLVQQRLREVLGRDRAVLDTSESAALARAKREVPRTLRIELEELSQVFDSPAASFGVVRLRATLMESTPAGDRLVGQRVFAQRQPAPSADAPGGVRAIAAATDACAQDIAAWLAQAR